MKTSNALKIILALCILTGCTPTKQNSASSTNPNLRAPDLVLVSNATDPSPLSDTATLLDPDHIPVDATAQAQHVALLLPLTGSLSAQAAAIRDGFLANYYAAREKNPAAPLPAKISFIDTHNDRTIVAAYQEATRNGATVIVGPLTKAGINTLIAQDAITLPTLALNYADNTHTPAELYQFGLSPENEATAAATHAIQNGHYTAALLGPNTIWGKRILSAFQIQFEALGGRITQRELFQSREELILPVQKILQIPPTVQPRNSPKTAIPVARKETLPGLIFLAGEPKEARQIPPLLSFYRADSVPVYSVSNIYNGTPNAPLNQDLNGVTFCDIPWIVSANPVHSDIEQSIMQLWPNATAQIRFYALGVDSYYLLPHLEYLKEEPNIFIRGSTGLLALNASGEVSRTLQCTQFKSGIVQKQ